MWVSKKVFLIEIRSRDFAVTIPSLYLHTYGRCQLDIYSYMYHGVFVIYRTFPKVYTSLVLIDFSLTVKAATLIFISGRGLAISSAQEGKSGFIYNLVKS